MIKELAWIFLPAVRKASWKMGKMSLLCGDRQDIELQG